MAVLYQPEIFTHRSSQTSACRPLKKFTHGLICEQMRIPAEYDDMTTMALRAAKQAVARHGIKSAELGAIYVGTETAPHQAKATAITMAGFMGVRDVKVADKVACAAGLEVVDLCTALVESDTVKYVLAIASDRSKYPAYSSGEPTQGAAFLIGEHDLIAQIEDVNDYTVDVNDFVIRRERDIPYWSGPYSVAAYKQIVHRLLKRYGVMKDDIDYCALYTPYGKLPLKVMKEFGLDNGQIKSKVLPATPKLKLVGNAYGASSLMATIGFFHMAESGERILTIAYGSGVHGKATLFRVEKSSVDVYPTLDDFIRVDRAVKQYSFSQGPTNLYTDFKVPKTSRNPPLPKRRGLQQGEKMEVVIVSAARTAIGKFMGAISTIPAPRLGAKVIRAVVQRAGLDVARIDEVIMGNVLSAGLGQNPARQAAMGAGIPAKVPAFTVNKVCASSLKAVALAAQAIRAGDAEVVIAGGMESMSGAPHLLPGLRVGHRMGNVQLIDAMVLDGLWCSMSNAHMGRLAELVADKYHISRRAQDEFALESHRKAVRAIEGGKFRREIVPLRVGDNVFNTDERPRPDTTLEKLAKLKPAFKKGGTITAGNACGLNDGAAALLIMSASRCGKLGLSPMARIEGYTATATDPRWFGLAPISAVRQLLRKTGRRLTDYDLYEVNEPFAAVTLAIQQELGLDGARLNVRGGAIALGHPIGATGARILVTLLHALQDRGEQRGLAAICLGGGGAVALAIEMV